MAIESPLRLTGSSEARNWTVSKDIATFSSTINVAAHELGLLLNGHRFHGERKHTGPNRCGSAPPSIEVSLVALGNLTDQHNSSFDSSFESLSIAVETCGSEEQLRAHPAYLAYYCSNVNLNPRLPPPLISQENRRLVHHIGGFMENWRVPSFDDSSKRPWFISRPSLSTHKEEPEDDRSPRLETIDRADRDAGFLSRQFTSPLQGHHKSLVDLIQEDFPRTPSPVYNNQSRPSSHSATEQAADPDALARSLRDSPTNMAVPELEAASVGVHACTPMSCVQSVKSVLYSDATAAPVPCSASSDRTVDPHRPEGKSSSNDDTSDNGASPNAVSGLNIGRTDKETKDLKIFNDGQRSQHPQQNSLHEQGPSSQLLTGQSQMVAQVMHRSNAAVDHFSHDQSKLSSVELQPVFQATGITLPLYATTATYGAPYYHDLHPSSVISSPFSIGGYALNTSLFQPLLTGYPPHNAIHMPFGNHASQSFNVRDSGVLNGGIASGVDLQQFYKFYGQLGVAIQPSFLDSLYMPYFPHPSIDAYAGAGRYDPMISGGGVIGSPPGNYDLQRGLSTSAYLSDQRSQTLKTGGSNNTTARRGGTVSASYYGSSSNIGALMQYPPSPFPSPAFQGSPGDGTSFSGRKTENMKLPLSSGRPTGAFSGQRGCGKVDDKKFYSFLEELKSSKGRRFELSDIAGCIVEFSTDQLGSRFIQQKLKTCSIEEKTSVFEEVLPLASTLMTDVFGNYVIQKFFEYGSSEQRKKLANQLVGHILPLSLQMYGCRVVQKALEVIELDQKTQLVHELDGHVMRCVRDQNGNHVIQKCIECVPTEKIGFIISAFCGQVASLSMHPYGCRVIQRVLEHWTDELQIQCIVDEILQSVCILAQDQYGNYVTQHVLERGKSHERSQIISKLAGKVVQMSQHKFASNVIEKCLEHGDSAERELLIEEIVGQTEGNDNLLIMMKDQFANYVVQKFLETCTENQRKILLNRARVHLQALKKYTYGKHIVSRVEQLCGEETHPGS